MDDSEPASNKGVRCVSNIHQLNDGFFWCLRAPIKYPLNLFTPFWAHNCQFLFMKLSTFLRIISLQHVRYLSCAILFLGLSGSIAAAGPPIEKKSAENLIHSSINRTTLQLKENSAAATASNNTFWPFGAEASEMSCPTSISISITPPAYCTNTQGVLGVDATGGTFTNPTYQWSTSNGRASISNTTSATPDIDYITSGTTVISVTVTDGGICGTFTASQSITISSTPEPTISISTTEVCQGNTINNITGSPSGSTRQWTVNNFSPNNPFGTFSAPTNQTTNFTANNPGNAEIFYEVTTTAGCTGISEAQPITIFAPVTSTAAIQSGNQPNVCADATLTLAASAAGGNGSYSYVWEYMGGTQVVPTFVNASILLNDVNAQNPVLTPVGTASDGDTYLFRVKATDGILCEDFSDNITITVRSITSAALSITGASTICEDGTTTFKVDVTRGNTGGSPTYTLVYNDGTADITVNDYVSGSSVTTNAQSADCSLSIVSIKDARVSVSNCNSPSNGSAATVTVNNLSAGSISGEVTICSGDDPAEFGSNAATGDGTITYLWESSTDGTNFTTTGITTETLDPAALTADTWYRRVATSTQNAVPCSKTSNTLKVTVNNLTAGTVGADQTICSGDDAAAFTVATAATGDGTLSYQWQISTDGGAMWNDINAATDATYDEGTLTADAQYRRITTSTLDMVACTATSNVITVTVNNVTAGEVAGDQTICSTDDAAAFTEVIPSTGDGTLSYQWQISTDGGTVWNDINTATASTYDEGALSADAQYRRITTSTLNMVACSATSNVITVTVNNLTAGVIAADQSICSGQTASFTEATAATADGTISYLWQSSTDGGMNWISAVPAGTAATYTTGALTQNTQYRRKDVSSLNSVNCDAYTNVVAVTVQTSTAGVWYVNDATGNDANLGTENCPKKTIGAAVTAAAAGDIINVAAGSYTGNILITKTLDIRGANYGISASTEVLRATRGDETILNGAFSIGNVSNVANDVVIDGFRFIGSSVTFTDRTKIAVIRGLRAKIQNNIFDSELAASTGFQVSGGSTFGITTGGSYDQTGLEVQDNYFVRLRSGVFSNPSVSTSALYSNNQFSSRTGINFDHFGSNSYFATVSDNNFAEVNIGGEDVGPVTAINCTALLGSSNMQFTGNTISSNYVGIDFKDIKSGATVNVSNNFFTKRPSAPGVTYHLWVRLFPGSSGVTLNNNSFTEMGLGTAITNAGTGTIDATCNWYGSLNANTIASKVTGNVTYSPWLVDGTDDQPSIGFQPVPGSCTGTAVAITAATVDQIWCGETTGSIEVVFSGGDGPYDIAWTGGSATGVTSPYTISALALGTYGITITDANGSTDTETGVQVQYLPVHNTTADTRHATIQAAIDAALASHVIEVCAGTYNEDVNVNKQLTLLGAGVDQTIVSGPIGGDVATLRVASSGVIIDGFTITRDGNNLTDWNNSGLNSIGVAILGQGYDGEIRNCKMIGNRTGIDVNNSNDNNIHNNIITFNRTGLIFRNQTDNTNLTENEINDNWTAGLLFLDASSGSNSPLQQALNSTFSSNQISGNWYGDIVDRQSGGSLPAPGTTNIKNFECNWFGVTSPVVSTANSSEPGYSDLIPELYGGTSNPPGGQPNILGTASANFDYISWLVNGTDNDGATLGFQPVPGSCTGTPVEISSATKTADAICDADAKITVTFSGGTAPYDIAWAGGSATGISSPYVISGLASGSYTATVTDANGSTAASSAVSISTFSVGNENTGVGYATIKAAHDAATAGDVIKICAGVYNEPGFALSKAITLKGAQSGVDARTRGASETGETVLSGTGRIFDLNASGIILDGLYFRNLAHRGMDCYQNANGFTVRNCVINVTSTNSSGGAIQFGGGSNLTANNLVFEKNLVTGSSAGYALYILHSAADGLIQDNILNSRRFMFGPFGQAGGWQIKRNLFDGEIGGTAHVGYPINAQFGNAVVDGNTLRKLSAGMQISIVGGSITNNVFDDNNFFGFELFGGAFGSPVSSDVTIANNTFSFNGVGTNARGLRVGRAAGDPNNGLDPAPGIDGSTIRINDNSFTDLGFASGIKAAEFNGSNTLDAECNWWGTVNANTIASKLSAQTDYSPYRVDGTDTDGVAIGFQPALNTCTGTPVVISSATPTDETCGVAGSILVAFQDGQSPYDIAWTGGSSLGVTSPSNIGGLNAGTYDITITDANGSTATAVATVQYLPVHNVSANTYHATIQAAIDAATGGDNIEICAGTYTAQAITVNKRLNINGQGDATIIQNNAALSTVFTYTAAGSGTDAVNRAYLRNVKVSGSNRGLLAAQVVNHLTLDDVTFDGNTSYAIHVNNTSGVMNDWEITNCTFNANSAGLYVATAANIDGVSVTGSTFTNQTNTAFYAGQSSGTPGGFSNVTITGNTFTDNGAVNNQAAFYLEKLSDAVISENTMTNNGLSTNPRGIIVNLKFGAYSNVSITDNTIVETRGAVQTNGYGINVQGRNDAPSHNSNPGSLEDVTVSGNEISGLYRGIEIDNDVNWNFTAIQNNTISGAEYGILGVIYGSGNTANSETTMNVHENSILANTSVVVNVNPNGGTIDAECNWYGTINGSIIADKIVGTVDYSPWLVDGTDDDLLTIGFQPVSGACSATAVEVTATQTNIIGCFGDATGAIDITVTGGVPPYTYAWSNDATTEDLTGLTAGTYTVTVTDGIGTTGTLSVTLTQPDAVTPIGTPSHVSCRGGNNGSIELTVTGGTGSYNFDWNGSPAGDGSSWITDLEAGTYTVTVTDANNCTGTTSVTVNEPASDVSADISGSTNVSCNGGTNGTATVAPAGGTPGYTYSWSNNQTAATATGLAAGTYTVTVTDLNNCEATASVTISEPSALSASITAQTNVSCNGLSDGSATVEAMGGTSPYTYDWAGTPAGTVTITGINAGSYTVTITDNLGCSVTTVATITQPDALSLMTTQMNATCNGDNDGTATVTPDGGTTPYTYVWSNGQTDAMAIDLIAGTYTVTVTDANGCAGTTSVSITQPAVLAIATSPTSATASVACGTTTAVNTEFSTWNTGVTYTGGAPLTDVTENYTVTADVNGSLVETYNGVDPTAPPADGGFTVVTWTVTDGCGNTATVSATFTVNNCMRISGALKYYRDDAGVGGVNVDMVGTGANDGISAGDGSYTVYSNTTGNFDVIPASIRVCEPCTTGTVVSTANLKDIYNISVEDVDAIKAHIAAGAQFDKIHQRAAANVVLGTSGSQTNNRLTSADATALSQAINGSLTQQQRLSRRAVPHDEDLIAGAPDPLPRSWGLVPVANAGNQAPAQYGDFTQKRNYPTLDGAFTSQDFVVLQVGDVTDHNSLRGEDADARYAGSPLIWKVKDAELTEGEVIDAAFTIEQMQNLRGWQFGLQFDPEYLKVDTLTTTNALPLDPEVNFGLYQAEMGEIRSLWTDGVTKSLNKGESVFTLRFTALQGGKNLSEVLKLEEGSATYALTDQRDHVAVLLAFDAQVQPNQSPVLYQNTPNPFNMETSVRFELPEASDIQLTIHDVNGRMIQELNGYYSKGLHEVRFGRGEMGQYSGVLYYTLRSGDFIATRKMVIID